MNIFQTGIPSELIKNSNVIYKILIADAVFSSKILNDMHRDIVIVCFSFIPTLSITYFLDNQSVKEWKSGKLQM